MNNRKNLFSRSILDISTRLTKRLYNSENIYDRSIFFFAAAIERP